MRGLLTAVIFICLLLWISACGSEDSAAELQGTAGQPEPQSSGLPAFPDPHTAQAQQQHVLQGRDSFSYSGGTLGATTIELNAETEMAWAQYGFGPLEASPDNLLVLLDLPEGNEVWIGLANYAKGRWELFGPFGASTGLVLDPEAHQAPSGAVYAAVIATQGNQARVNALSLSASEADNLPPQAVLNIEPSSGNAPFSAVFSAQGSTDDKAIVLYLWDFDGDGNAEETSTLPSAEHLYSEPGQYLSSVIVLDSEGLSHSDFVLVTVNAAPTASLSGLPSAEVYQGDTLQLDGSASADSDGEIVSYEWELDGDSDFNDHPVSVSSIPHIVLNSPGFKDVALRVTDDFGAVSTATLRITIKGIGGGKVQPQSNGDGFVSSMIVAGGLPMIAHVGGDGDLRFIRGSDSEPAGWIAASDDLSNEPDIRSCSLRLINGRPAVAFTAALTNEQFPQHTLKYVIAADALGEGWQPPVDLEVDGWVSPDSLRTVRGWPGIAYWNEDENSLYFVRPQDANGNNWADPFLISNENFAPGISLLVVDGCPAIAASRPVSGDNHLFFLRSDDEFGTAWPAGITVDDSSDGSTQPSLALLLGRPALSYKRGNAERLHFAHALDAAGSSWGEPQDLAQMEGAAKENRLTLVGGRPAIAYTGIDGAVYLLHALDNGGVSWDSPQLIAPASTAGPSISLAEIEGKAAVSLSSTGSNVEFYREY